MSAWVWPLVVVAMAGYCYWWLPFPFFRTLGASEDRLPLPPLSRRLWRAVASAPSELVLSAREAARVRAIFREPRRPFRSWRNLKAYYDVSEPAPARGATVVRLRFRGRLDVVMVLARLPLDHALSLLLNPALWLAYFLVVAAMGVRVRAAAARARTPTATERAAACEQLAEYLDRFVPPEGREPLSIFAEPGYFFFKLAEGRLFREAMARFGARHPNLEVGPDDGAVSALHLRDVDFFDAAMNTSRWQMAPTAKTYGEVQVGFLEAPPFQDESFRDIYLIHVVDHIPDLDHAFDGAVRLLAPGGRLFFSGLTDRFSGWWLERVCAAGHVYNNQPLDWYEALCARHGLVMTHGAYCHAHPADRLFAATYGFAMKTPTWELLGAWLGRTARRRRALRWVLRALYAEFHARDRMLAERPGGGLNFLVVAERPE